MTSLFDPQRLDVQAFARAAGTLSSRETLSKYERLMAESITDGGNLPVNWTARGEWRETAGSSGQAWLHLEVDGLVPLSCQRCLTRVDAPGKVNGWFRFVADEAAAEAEDDDCEEDLLVTSRSFDLLALVEDEMLLALPMVPMHEVCPVPVKLEVRDADFEEAAAPKENPFATLASIKDLVKKA